MNWQVVFLQGEEKSLQVREEVIIALLKFSNQRGAPQEKVAVAEQATEHVNNLSGYTAQFVKPRRYLT